VGLKCDLVMVSGGNCVGMVRSRHGWRRERGDDGDAHVNVSVDDFPFVSFGNYDAIYGSCCAGHFEVGSAKCSR
jgi:hypothetical protein